MVVRYAAFFDGRSGDRADRERFAELAASLVTLKAHVLPHVEKPTVLVYSGAPYVAGLRALLETLEIPGAQVADIVREEDRAFAEGIRHCEPVDRICIQRMLADARVLPADRPRLLIGNDVFFFRPPQELLAFVWCARPRAQVLYMVDDFTWGGELYRIRGYRPPILDGLLGDFYCLAPGASFSPEAVRGVLTMMDRMPPEDRWLPCTPDVIRGRVHGVEQQAASILLGAMDGQVLPTAHYHHIVARPETVVLHGKRIWECMARGEVPEETAALIRGGWERLGCPEFSDWRLPVAAADPSPSWIGRGRSALRALFR
jgi:hypothetical protein